LVKVTLGDEVFSAAIHSQATARVERNVDFHIVLIDTSIGAFSLRIGDTAATTNIHSGSERFKLCRSDELWCFIGPLARGSAIDS
jgi:hypothetical protein